MTAPAKDRNGALAWVPAGLLAVASLFPAVAFGLHPADEREAAGVFPLWWSQARSLDAAMRAGRVVSVGAAPFIVSVRAEAPNVAAALRKQGAWLVIDPTLAAACGSGDS